MKNSIESISGNLALSVCGLLLLAAGDGLAEEAPPAAGNGLRVPAYCAYLDPNPEGAIVDNSGIHDWQDPALKVQ